MSTIKSTIKLESNDLLFSQVVLTVASTNTINMDAVFSSAIVPIDGNVTVYGPTTEAIGSTKTVYVYAKAANTNNNYVRLTVNDGVNTSLIMQIAPGDFAWFPLAAFNAGVEVKLHNNSQTLDATVDFLFAEKG
jgi:hypothetical protein